MKKHTNSCSICRQAVRHNQLRHVRAAEGRGGEQVSRHSPGPGRRQAAPRAPPRQAQAAEQERRARAPAAAQVAGQVRRQKRL